MSHAAPATPAAATRPPADALAVFADTLRQAAQASDAEAAIYLLNKALSETLGSREAHLQPGNLKEGETQQFACGAFFLSEDGKENVLIGPVNYHPDQKHMRIDATLGHPGWIVANQKPLILPNTDNEPSFVKILRTFRAGSVVYAPIFWGGRFLGQIICASQARNVMSQVDLDMLECVCRMAGFAWAAHNGPDYLRKLQG